METTIRLDESRVINGWIKTTDDGYINENAIVQFRINKEIDDYIDRCFSVVALSNANGSAEVGYYPFTNVVEEAVAEEMAGSDLDAFVAKHGRLF